MNGTDPSAAIAAVRETHARAKYADRHYPETWRRDAWAAHVRAIIAALQAGHTGREITEAQR